MAAGIRIAALRAAVISIVLASAGACSSGGGGGGGTPPPNAVPFTSFGAIAADQTVIMEGIGVTASGTQTATAITSMTINPAHGGEVRLSYDGSRALSAISINTPHSSVSFDRNVPGHSVSCSGTICAGENPTASGLAVDAFGVGWNYQSFGVWGVDTSPTTFALGAISAGRLTSGNAIPMINSAVFNGVAAGFFFDLSGAPFATAAAMTANVDFGSRNIAFSTSNTNRVSLNTGIQTTDSGLDLSGTLTYAPGVNGFSGEVRIRNNLLIGQASGRFYGPNAEEIGGVYSLQGTSLGRMVGGFGGKR